MNKAEKMIIKAFLIYPIPQDFLNTSRRMLMIESIVGLANRVYSGDKILKEELSLYELDDSMKKEISCILSNCDENLMFYYLLKMTFLILKNNSL